MKAEFKIDIMYFKPSGKLYIRDSFVQEFEAFQTPGAPTLSCYMNSVTEYIRELRRIGSPLPGLSSCNQDFFIVVDCEQGYPCLISPTLFGGS